MPTHPPAAYRGVETLEKRNKPLLSLFEYPNCTPILIRVGFALDALCIQTDQWGRAIMNDKYNLYAHRDAHELRKLYSKKFNRLQRLRSQQMGYFVKREIAALQEQMKAIEAELAKRDAQLALF